MKHAAGYHLGTVLPTTADGALLVSSGPVPVFFHSLKLGDPGLEPEAHICYLGTAIDLATFKDYTGYVIKSL